MDAESGELLFLGGGVAADSWQLDAPLSCSELVYGGSEKPLQDWAVDPDCATANCDSESEDVLHAVDPNEVFPNGPPADPSSESDSGVSEEPVVESPVAVATEATVYQVVYDISGLRGVKAEPGRENVISIELDEWSSQMLFSDSCIVSELPLVAAPLSTDDDLLNPDLQLTEEEQKLLNQEGVSLPNNLPLTKAEERVLKKVRRKIRNKQSAQDSRRRRKEYVDGLESRAAACSAQNKELQRTVEQLEKHNMSLLSQLRRLQSLIKQTVSKGAQTSTCLLIILVSLGLIIMPSFSPFRRNTSVDDDYRPVGDEVESPAAQPDSMSPPAADASQSGRPQGAAAHPREPIEDPVHPGVDGTAREGSHKGNGSALVAGQTEPPDLGRRGRKSSSKPEPQSNLL
ncbi:putative cyclic AMP-responsive element-binding protein 3-like protein 4 [Scophthalmus maximus]|uniref:Cyclic AMP-responsive element-binding protein 3-like protein 4 n=1 Tax=Scophthalmus maximus TaxID=52904 RepID=A0A2U9CH50_SCOMX|nr:putative cyclic AMP-responsive element-binding protein 3-like protein 4 [Scophthalmus maximus]